MRSPEGKIGESRYRRFWRTVGAIPNIPEDQLASTQNKELRPGKLRKFFTAIGAIPKRRE